MPKMFVSVVIIVRLLTTSHTAFVSCTFEFTVYCTSKYLVIPGAFALRGAEFTLYSYNTGCNYVVKISNISDLALITSLSPGYSFTAV